MSIFKAKKVIPENEIFIESGRPVITPPKEKTDSEGNITTIPATINFQIKDVQPVELTEAEWKKLKNDLIKIAERAPNLKEIEEIDKYLKKG